ncbi:hypothetical protein [Evansella cellulosilytica]|uniref:Lipoprotein n=1 Tax=Evansella cellulosilytica (strain ATCC 21833 / DSM 2522 / FERM P-1141 / JCM 9156 / N-4) TaxID=649639 RepID=E6TUQ9_EVAC2|nr:hypothetical protein [Evansella cellulosilytica]ADU32061.1 hypothetical protein Bcell_3822 [Evansella cellulosilytica DSM 2522]
MRKIFLLTTLLIFLAACSKTDGNIEDYVHFNHSVPEFDGYELALADVSPRKGNADSLSLYYYDESNIPSNRDTLSEAEKKEISEAYDIKAVYGSYSDYIYHRLHLYQQNKPFEDGLFGTIVTIDSHDFNYAKGDSDGEPILIVQTEYNDTFYRMILFLDDEATDDEIEEMIGSYFSVVFEYEKTSH